MLERHPIQGVFFMDRGRKMENKIMVSIMCSASKGKYVVENLFNSE